MGTSREVAPARQDRLRARVALMAACWLATAGCSSEREAATGSPAASNTSAATAFAWPGGRHDVAVLRIRDLGEIRLELYPELAPLTVENFVELASSGFYDGTLFHRVIPGFMIQGGDPNSRDRDPADDGYGDPGYKIPDELSDVPHERGVVSMANLGQPNSAGSQFFIVQQASPQLDGKYTAFGRVVEGMEVVDRITQVERDEHGRWGPKDRPIERIEVARAWIEPADASRRAALGAETPSPEPTATTPQRSESLARLEADEPSEGLQVEHTPHEEKGAAGSGETDSPPAAPAW